MKCESYQQFAIVTGDSAHSLSEQLNAELKRLRHKHPVVTFEGMIARIMYEETETEAEDLRDEYEKVGVDLRCEDCPLFLANLKADGTEDKRSKYGTCPVAKFGKVPRCGRACDKLYEMINDGRVKLCLAE